MDDIEGRIRLFGIGAVLNVLVRFARREKRERELDGKWESSSATSAHDYDTGKLCFHCPVRSLHETLIERDRQEIAADPVNACQS